MLTIEHLAELLERYPEASKAKVAEFEIAGRAFRFNSAPALMGVINLSADSWYRESVCLSAQQAIERGKVLQAQGADIVDVGAESTLAHAALVEERAQLDRLLPVIKGLAEAKILTSVETYDFKVARTSLEAGARIINLTGSQGSAEIFRLAADHAAAVIICYVQGANVRQVDTFDLSRDPVELMYDYFAKQINLATKSGLDKVFIDPGLGFYYRNLQDSAKRVRHQVQVFLNTFRLRTLGFPVCHALPHAFEYFGEEVRSAEPFFAVLAALGKTDLFRTHEVPRVKAVLKTLSAIPEEVKR